MELGLLSTLLSKQKDALTVDTLWESLWKKGSGVSVLVLLLFSDTTYILLMIK